MSSTAFTSGPQEQGYIEAQAALVGLDPRAVLAVAAHEGVTLPAEVGDHGTSFGPWQLHAGGRLPDSIWNQGPAYAQSWANSPAGIDYALAGIKSAVGSATQGPAEIAAQVNNFEQPLQSLRAGEISSSIATYNAGGGPRSQTGSTAGPLTPNGGGVSNTNGGGGGGFASAVFGGIENDISGSIEELFLRGIELFAAVVLVWVGLKGLAAALRSPGATQLANQFYSSGRGVGSAAAAPFMGGGAA